MNAVVEGVKGSRLGAPYEEVSDSDAATRKRLASLRIQEGFARLVEGEARRRSGRRTISTRSCGSLTTA